MFRIPIVILAYQFPVAGQSISLWITCFITIRVTSRIRSAGWVAEQWKPTLPYGPPLGVVGGPRGDRKRKVRLEMTTLGLGSGIGGRGVIRRVRSTQKQNLLKAGEEWGVCTPTLLLQHASRKRQ